MRTENTHTRIRKTFASLAHHHYGGFYYTV